MADFKKEVYSLVMQIPQGKVLGYGDVAGLLGWPGYARHVGFALSVLGVGSPLPWWRVLRSDGSIAMQGDPSRGPIQLSRLRSETVTFRGRRVDMGICRWEPDIGG